MQDRSSKSGEPHLCIHVRLSLPNAAGMQFGNCGRTDPEPEGKAYWMHPDCRSSGKPVIGRIGGVPRHFQIADAPEEGSGLRSFDIDRTFPIARTEMAG